MIMIISPYTIYDINSNNFFFSKGKLMIKTAETIIHEKEVRRDMS